jgi:hypothetical protein
VFPEHRALAGGLRSKNLPDLKAGGAGSWIRFLIVLLVACGGWNPAFARAQDAGSYAGIVIRPGDGTITYAYVPLDETVSGIELLKRSGISLVTIGFGGLGEGVCQIEETGCDVGPCRIRVCQTGSRDSPFWQYFQPDDNGEWVASPLGGSATKVAPGEVDGWSWTPDEALLPEVTIGEIPRLAGAGSDLETAHFARYDANGNLVDEPATRELEKRAYGAVFGVLGAVAIFALVLRLRARDSV